MPERILAKPILFFDRRVVLACDGRCAKAWGIASRPKVQLSDDEDDYAFLADDELGEAPRDPGTYEGGYIDLDDFSRRVFNVPGKHEEEARRAR